MVWGIKAAVAQAFYKGFETNTWRFRPKLRRVISRNVILPGFLSVLLAVFENGGPGDLRLPV